jgi:predicted kinase
MAKIILEVGAPASGKSTCAKEKCAKDGNLVRVNRDDIRSMGFGNARWTPHREKWVVAAEEQAVVCALTDGFTPVVDSTNLMPHRIEKFKSLAKQVNAELVICDHTDVPIEELVRRDATRLGDARVGRVVIEKLIAQAGGLPKPTRSVVLCDVDGTLANLEHRKQWIQGEKRDYHTFFGQVSFDAPIWETIHLVEDLAKENDIWVVSGRPDFHVEDGHVFRVGEYTIEWLTNMGVPFKYIFMRRAGDRRPDTDVKREILKKQILTNITKDQIKCVVDDRPAVIRMWREEGLEVIDVGDGVEF